MSNGLDYADQHPFSIRRHIRLCQMRLIFLLQVSCTCCPEKKGYYFGFAE